MGRTGPCIICADYPHHCRGLCIDKQAYINEVNEDITVIHKQKVKKSKSNTFYEKGKAYVYNKNGIRREVPTR